MQGNFEPLCKAESTQAKSERENEGASRHSAHSNQHASSHPPSERGCLLCVWLVAVSTPTLRTGLSLRMAPGRVNTFSKARLSLDGDASTSTLHHRDVGFAGTSKFTGT